MKSEGIELATSAPIARAAVNTNSPADSANMKLGGWIKLASPAEAHRPAVAAGIGIVGMVVELGGAYLAAIPVAG